MNPKVAELTSLDIDASDSILGRLDMPAEEAEAAVV